MILQRRFLRKVNGKSYYKFMVQIKPENIRDAGFEEGEDLEVEIKKGEIILKKKLYIKQK